MRARVVPCIVAALAVFSGTAWADGEPAHPVAMRIVGDLCRVRAAGPLSCPSVASVSLVRRETASLQLVLEASAPVTAAVLELEADPALRVVARREIFLPVRSRSRGPDSRGDALPWSAAARPPDESVLGMVADPLVADLAPDRLAPKPEARTAVWLDIAASDAPSTAVPGTHAIRLRVGSASSAIEVEILDADLPPPPVPAFAYVEDDELRDMPSPDGAREAIYEMLRAHHVDPVGRLLDVADLDRDRRYLGEMVVLGVYGTLGDPTPDAVARVERMARKIDRWHGPVLYAVDETCDSPRPRAWRQALAASDERRAREVRVLATCDRISSDVDVPMVQPKAFDEDVAVGLPSEGREVWLYNGSLPHAGPLALDGPPESLVWNGWIGVRYTVGRWFYWNTNHWTDRNRGGKGPRDLYDDTETFHNADGDVVLEDGVLVYPAYQREGFAQIESPEPVLGSIRLAHLRRGLEDAALLMLVYEGDPDAARSALGRIVPAALGDVSPYAKTPFGGAEAIGAARASLHEAIRRARADGRLAATFTPEMSHKWLPRLRKSMPRARMPTGAPALLIGLAVFAVGGALAVALERLRRHRRKRSTRSSPW